MESQDSHHKKHRTDCNEKADIILLGVGCAGSFLLNKLSKKYKIEAFEAGIDRRYDGFTYNLALRAPDVHSQYDKVAAKKPLYPAVPAQWTGLTFEKPWNESRPVANSVITSITPNVIISGTGLNWTQGYMLGGSNEHIQGVYVNPSSSRCRWWKEILNDERYAFENLFPLLIEMEEFRDHTNLTSQTWDGTTYTAYDGPSAEGCKPKNRGFCGPVEVVQNSPSKFSEVLSAAIYNRFHNVLGYENFKLEPIVNPEKGKCPETFNSGVNICVTKATETYLDRHRTRTSMARSYLNSCVMKMTDPSKIELADSSAGYVSPGYSGVVYRGSYEGINGRDFTLNFGNTIQRIVFKTKKGFPNGKDYWYPNIPLSSVNPKAFKNPLEAIGVEYIDPQDSTKRIFVPTNNVICSLGTLATPILLMQSGIGPADVLKKFNIPVLFDQPNLGKYVSNHVGAFLRWTGNADIWGVNELGKDASNGYLPGPDSNIRRKFQYFSSYNDANAIPPIPRNTWQISLFDLNPVSTGYIVTKQSLDTNGGLLDVEIHPEYYTDPLKIDITNLCWIVRHVYNTVITTDPTAVFTIANDSFSLPDDQLFTRLMTSTPTSFNQQQHFVGSCGMGNYPEIHCVTKEFLLRGTKNVSVCDASSTPLDIDKFGNIFPVQNDGNTTRIVNVLTSVFTEQLLGSV